VMFMGYIMNICDARFKLFRAGYRKFVRQAHRRGARGRRCPGTDIRAVATGLAGSGRAGRERQESVGWKTVRSLRCIRSAGFDPIRDIPGKQ
jgi:hypothetical protein